MRNPIATLATFLVLTLGLAAAPGDNDSLRNGFANPPNNARLRAYWWWLNGNVTKGAITRDLEEMKAKGFGGAVIFDASGADQDGNDKVPHGPTFFTPEWRELYKHTLREANRLGLEISLNMQSGWNLGGPIVKPEEASKVYTCAEKTVSGPSLFDGLLPAPKAKQDFYREIAVVAFPKRNVKHKPIQMFNLKTAAQEFGGSAPDCKPLLEDIPAQPGEEDCSSSAVLDVSRFMAKDGRLKWKVPAGEWTLLRFGYTISGAKVSTCSEGWDGLALDYLDPLALQSYWRQIIAPLIKDAGPLAGTALKYLHTDSWELGGATWTPQFREEFRKRRGYDLLPYLPVLAGKIVDSRPVSNRFLHDFRKTVGDCIAENHYLLMSKMAHRHGLGIHPESGGPHGAPIDSLRNMGISDIPMSEFWARSWRHRVGDVNRFFVKQPASAAHTYGRPIVAAEGFTSIGPQWQETLWDNLKPSFDQAACEGLNLLVWHAFTCSPAETGLPGQEYFAGTHFNPKSTWWDKSGAFLGYVDRCQFLLQQGLFVADACYYYGDNVPNFAQLKASDPAQIFPGYDYDVATEDVVLNRMSVRNGRVVLPDGMSYRLLVLPDQNGISLPVLRKVKKLVEAGATVIGRKPVSATGLRNYPQSDKAVARLADELWGCPLCDGKTGSEHKVGKGRVICCKTARQVLVADGIQPDFEFAGSANAFIDYIHRSGRDAELYFIANRTNRFEQLDATFRVSGKVPEIWDAVTGQIRPAAAWSQANGRTTLPLAFDPYGSIFVVFRKSAAPDARGDEKRNFPTFSPAQEISGSWTVHFNPAWGAPKSVTFPQLTSWTTRPEEGIKFYSGTATYEKDFDLVESTLSTRRLVLDLGEVKNLAEVRLNGKSLGVLWTFPFRVDVSGLLRPTGNRLEIEVVNFWPNRVIGDQFLPKEKRLTRTNIRKLTKETPLADSGLLGPVQLLFKE